MGSGLRSSPAYDVRQVVDAMLAADKTLAGDADWRTLYGEQKSRWRKPCLIQGLVSDLELEVQAYPYVDILKFRIILIYTKAIYRLDYCCTDGHLNPIDRPSHLPFGPINEPHVHEWRDNRRFATKTTLPNALDNASILNRNINDFDRAFRWFCGEVNITVPSMEMPMLPPRTRLL
jgi:hypothetical protein